MSSCCPICYRESVKNVAVPNQKVERFFRLFLRYLGLGGVEESGMQTQLENQLSGVGMMTCEQCMPLMESFGELYHQLKSTELLMNWKVETLKSVMSCAVKVPLRMANLKNSMTRIGAPEMFEDVIKSRKFLIKKCCQKLTSAYPKLDIEKWRPEWPDKDAMVTRLLQSNEWENGENEVFNTTSNEDLLSWSPEDPKEDLESDNDPSLNYDSNNPPSPNGSLVLDGNQTETPQNGEDQGSTMDKVSDTDPETLGVPISDQVLVSPSLKSELLPIKMEFIDRNKIITERNMESASLEVVQIQLENHPSIPTDHVASDIKLASHPQNVTSRLRSSYRCQHCYRTFSSEERLQLHKTEVEVHIDKNDRGDRAKHAVLVSDDNDESDEDLSNGSPAMPQQLKHLRCKAGNCEATFSKMNKLEYHSKYHGDFKCFSCEASYGYAPDLSCHEISSHSNNKPERKKNGKAVLHCPRSNCPFYSTNKQTYMHHHVTVHLKLNLIGLMNSTVCEICSAVFCSLKRVQKTKREHYGSHHNLNNLKLGESIVRCGQMECKAYFLTTQQLLTHQRIVHTGGGTANPKLKRRKLREITDTTVCEICSAVSESQNIRRTKWEHYETYHNTDNLKQGTDVIRCDHEECEAYFLSSRQLSAHKRRVHNGDRNYSCLVCNIDYKLEFSLNRHKLKHHTEGLLHRCTVTGCKYRTDTEHSLEHHITQAHKMQRETLRCPKCPKKFFGKSGLIMHLKCHTSTTVKNQPVICETCGKKFRNKFVLQIHYKSHSGPDSWRFMCSVCSRKCLTKVKLDEHMRTHTQDKPFVCQICGQKYAHRHNLRIHVNSKHGDVMEDKPRKFDKTNLTSRKGVKRKGMGGRESGQDQHDSDSETDTN